VTGQPWSGPLLGLIVLTLLVALPIKIGAHLVKAEHRGLIRCGFTAFVAALGGLLGAVFLGGLLGGTLAWALGYLLAIRAMLGTSFLGAVGVAIVATLISVATLLALMHLGWLLASPSPAGSVSI
jgi:hypothetical protein